MHCGPMTHDRMPWCQDTTFNTQALQMDRDEAVEHGGTLEMEESESGQVSRRISWLSLRRSLLTLSLRPGTT